MYCQSVHKAHTQHLVGKTRKHNAGRWPMKDRYEQGTGSKACVSSHLVQLNGIDPVQSVVGVLCPEIPDTVIHADVKTTLIKFVRLWGGGKGVLLISGLMELKKLYSI